MSQEHMESRNKTKAVLHGGLIYCVKYYWWRQVLPLFPFYRQRDWAQRGKSLTKVSDIGSGRMRIQTWEGCLQFPRADPLLRTKEISWHPDVLKCSVVSLPVTPSMPSIWATPGPVVLQGSTVSIFCGGPPGTTQHHLNQAGSSQELYKEEPKE
jgi:hypothetical protein